VLGPPAASQPGFLIYLMVDNAAATIDRVVGNGGEIAQSIGADAREITARFRDPAENPMGRYQEPA
jgi:predicted enzyme related to lactoylglutathione lyase